MTRTNTANGRELTAPLARSAVALCLALGLGCEEEQTPPGQVEPETAECVRDDHSAPADAIAAGESNSGFVCPVEDADWYQLTIGPAERLVRVGLSMAAELSPVEPTYAIYRETQAGEPDQAVASARAARTGGSLEEVHCLDSGPHLLAVRDAGDDAQDVRNEYSLTVQTGADPDGNEPNEGPETSTLLASGDDVTAWIACSGDVDVYRLEVPEGNLLHLRLTSAIAGWEPTLELLDTHGSVVVFEENLSGSVEPTEIDRYEVLPGAGTYYVVVRDDDGVDADPDVAYQLSVDFVVDSDPNEPNNHPDEATALAGSAQDCGAGSTFTATGTIGSPGDDDWFVLPLSGCERGVLQARVALGTDGLSDEDAWVVNSQVQATVTMVRPHAESPCNRDEECTTLQQACSDDIGCAGVFDTCLGQQGLCAGATVCLPQGFCGANVVQRHYACNSRLDECQPEQTPPANSAEFAAPLFGQDVAYLRVSDFQANGAAPDRIYDLDVRIFTDPDPGEPSNVFTNVIDPDFPNSEHRRLATEIPVHDCTSGDCCGGGDWVDGWLSYENDLDFFSYLHPCPGEDCTLRFHYRVDEGPVDTVMNIRRGGSLWFTAFDLEELGTQPAISGTMGGTTESDRCFYAYNGHGDESFRYYVEVRDLFELYSDEETVRPDSRDWSSAQRYSLCVEKISNVCEVPPCQIYENGCGQPR